MEERSLDSLSDWDFMRLFLARFGLRRVTQLMGFAAVWMMSGEESVAAVVKKLQEQGVSSRAAAYRAAADLKEFQDYLQGQKVSGVTFNELVRKLASMGKSPMRDNPVV